MNLLFVCNFGKYRSRTAEDLLSGKFNTKSAGIISDTNPLTKSKLDFADIVFVMEDHQEEFIKKNFPKEYSNKKVVCLGIENLYGYNDETLKKLILDKVRLHHK